MLEQGQVLDPEFKGFHQNTVATYSMWAETFMKKKDWAGAIAIYTWRHYSDLEESASSALRDVRDSNPGYPNPADFSSPSCALSDPTAHNAALRQSTGIIWASRSLTVRTSTNPYTPRTRPPTVAHVCDTDIPAALELLAETDVAAVTAGARIPLDSLVEEGLRPLAERRAPGKILVSP